MRRGISIGITEVRKTIMLLAALGLAGALWAADPIIGTWKMNSLKSSVEGPEIQEAAHKYCISCGHCVSIGGTKALLKMGSRPMDSPARSESDHAQLDD